jgi:uncharacterized protein YcbX
VLLDGAREDSLIGSTFAASEAILKIVRTIQRCVMVTRPQPGGIDHDPAVLRTLARKRGARLAVGALVTHPGIIRIGDELKPR